MEKIYVLKLKLLNRGIIKASVDFGLKFMYKGIAGTKRIWIVGLLIVKNKNGNLYLRSPKRKHIKENNNDPQYYSYFFADKEILKIMLELAIEKIKWLEKNKLNKYN